MIFLDQTARNIHQLFHIESKGGGNFVKSRAANSVNPPITTTLLISIICLSIITWLFSSGSEKEDHWTQKNVISLGFLNESIYFLCGYYNLIFLSENDFKKFNTKNSCECQQFHNFSVIIKCNLI